MNPKMTSSTYSAELEHEALINITGPDATKFLQGQITCDAKALTSQASLGAHCTHKGRALFSFLALAPCTEDIFLRLPANQAEAALATLNKYIVFSKAKANLVTSNYHRIGVWGAGAKELIDKVFGVQFDKDGSFASTEQYTITRLDNQRYECWLTTNQTTQIEQIQLCTTASNTSSWQRLDIAAGIGHIQAENREEFIPQMLNYHRLGGISFTKGCYTGQEVIARMKYHGKLKRHMYRVSSHGKAPATGDLIFNGDSEQSVGRIVIAIDTSEGFEALVVTTDTSVDTDNLHINQENPQKLTQQQLPYAINEE